MLGHQPLAAKAIPDAPENEAETSPDLRRPSIAAVRWITKALSVAAKAGEEDRSEIDRLVKDLMEASAARSVPRLKQAEAELEDLVFYLVDA